MSDTPKTDAALEANGAFLVDTAYVRADFARGLERELNARGDVARDSVLEEASRACLRRQTPLVQQGEADAHWTVRDDEARLCSNDILALKRSDNSDGSKA